MDGRTITDAMVAIDEELAVLNWRRQLPSELLTTFQIAPPAAEVEADRPAPTLPTDLRQAIGSPRMPQPAKGGKAKWDYPEIAAVILAADEGGERRVTVLVERYKVTPATAQWLVKRCREMSLIPGLKPFTAEPITRAPFDPQVARDEAAGPKVGPVQWTPGTLGWPAGEKPTAEPKPERFDAQAVAVMLDGAA